MSASPRPLVPAHWKNEPSDVLRSAVSAYLFRDTLSEDQIAALRGYFRHWIDRLGFVGQRIDKLSETVDGLTTREAIDDWLDLAIEAGVDPL